MSIKFVLFILFCLVHFFVLKFTLNFIIHSQTIVKVLCINILLNETCSSYIIPIIFINFYQTTRPATRQGDTAFIPFNLILFRRLGRNSTLSYIPICTDMYISIISKRWYPSNQSMR